MLQGAAACTCHGVVAEQNDGVAFVKTREAVVAGVADDVAVSFLAQLRPDDVHAAAVCVADVDLFRPRFLAGTDDNVDVVHHQPSAFCVTGCVGDDLLA